MDKGIAKAMIASHKNCQYLLVFSTKTQTDAYQTFDCQESLAAKIHKFEINDKYVAFFVKSSKEIIEIDRDGVEIHDAMPIIL